MTRQDQPTLRKLPGVLHGLYLTTGRVTKGGNLMAYCTDGTTQMNHDPITILAVQPVRSEGEAREWFLRIREERPWEDRQ